MENLPVPSKKMMKKQYPQKTLYFFIGFIFALQIILNAEEKRQIDLGKFSVSDDIPTSWMLAHTPYKDNRIITERKDIPEEIAEKERMFIWPWCTKVCSRDLKKSLEPSDIFFMSGIGEHKDDAGVFKWSYNKRDIRFDPRYDPTDQYDIELIDSRIITYLVRHDNFPNMDILDIFKESVQYYSTNKNFAEVDLCESHELKNGESYGKIKVKYDSARWFDSPIEWYRKKDYVLFVFEKVVTLPKLKMAYRYNPENNPVGGIPVSDPRSFRRFDNPNREQLTEEYFHKYFPPEILHENVVIGKDGEILGRFQDISEKE